MPHQMRGVLGGFLLEFLEAHMGAAVCLVGDGAEDHEGQVVGMADLGDGGTFHFGAGAVKLGDDAVFGFPGGDELVAGADTALHGPDARQGFLDGDESLSPQNLICFKSYLAREGNLALLETDGLHGEVVLDGIFRNHQIPHLQLVAERPGHAGVDDVGDLEVVHQNLGTDTRIDLANAALHHYRLHSPQPALAELHGSLALLAASVQDGLECLHFRFHSADDAYFHFTISPVIKKGVLHATPPLLMPHSVYCYLPVLL